ncbi:hypothetical protein D917_05931, partial [Trichinella nativa]
MISKHLKGILHCISIFFLQFFQYTVETVPCGTSVNSAVVNGYSLRIVRGSVVRPHSLPWQVLINIDNKSDDDAEDTICGGSLLKVQSEENSSNIVLTAAHCLYAKYAMSIISKLEKNTCNKFFLFSETLIDKSNITVVLGVHNRLIKESNQMVRKVADVKIHSSFS